MTIAADSGTDQMAGLGFIIFDSKCNVLFPNGPRMEDNNVAVKE